MPPTSCPLIWGIVYSGGDSCVSKQVVSKQLCIETAVYRNCVPKYCVSQETVQQEEGRKLKMYL